MKKFFRVVWIWLKVISVNFILIFLTLSLTESWLAFRTWDREFGDGRGGHQNPKKTNFDISDAVYPTSKFATKESLMKHLESQGIHAVSRFSPGAVVPYDGIKVGNEKLFPFTGFAKQKTVFCDESLFWAVYDSDEYGFRNPVDSWKHSVDVAYLGDSFTHGACVEDGNDFAGQMRKRGYSALNVGVGGTGPLIQYGIFREYIKKVKPKVLAWVYFAEDIRDGASEITSETLKKYLEDTDFTQNLRDSQSFTEDLLRRYYDKEYPKLLKKLADRREERRYIITMKIIEKAVKFGYTKDTLAEVFANKILVTEGNEWQKIKIFKDIFFRLKNETEAWGGHFVFVYLPTWAQFGFPKDSYGIKVDKNYLLRQDILKIAYDSKVPVINLYDFVAKSGDPLDLYNFREYGHFTPEGYIKVGSYLNDQLAPLIAAKKALSAGK